MIPLGLIHLILTMTGVIFFDQEWAVILEVAALQSLDGAITNEGLAFDAFGRTEYLVRQAAATVLAMFTISGALSVPRKNVGKMAVNLEKMGKTGAEYGNDRKSVGKTVG